MKRALVVIDMQVGLLAGPEAVAGADALAERVAGLCRRAREAGVPVVLIQDDDVGGGAGPEWEVCAALRGDGDVVVRKPYCDAFAATDLDARLRALGVEHLIACGVKTPFCVDTTVRRATSLGYGVTLVADGHGTTATPDLSAEAIVRHHNHVLDGLGVEIDGREHSIAVVPAAEIALG